MRLLVSIIVAAGLARAAGLPSFSVLGDDVGAWPGILSSIGLVQQPAALARVFVARAGSPASTEWNGRVERGDFLILEGESSLAEMFGVHRGAGNVKVTSLTDVHQSALSIVWQTGLELPVFELPAGMRVFARERWSGAPLLAGFRRGAGAVLWLAVPPGPRGYERFPYLLQALCDLGLVPPFRGSRLWAFFDSAYRSRVDLDYFAARWRRAGLAALQVAAWHFEERDTERDAWLEKLISACHRQGILVYAWLELPHVSDAFWEQHPEWREKTALGQDAQLDWRKLMNLANRDCFHAAAQGVRQTLEHFDWDGINLAELYFESLEGLGNPSRFTPMNNDVRAEFERLHGFDPIELFGRRRDEASRRVFLDYRAALARRIQEEWIGQMESVRQRKPYLDLALTHVDDRLDPTMRDAIGADAARVLPLLDSHSFTFLIEDPATVWDQGPERYPAIAARYQALTAHRNRLAIDLNVVERYQDVYPTRQQTGTELFEDIHEAAASFPRVALYFESSLLPADLPLLAAASAAVTRVEEIGPKLVVDSASGVGVAWDGEALVDGQPWPAAGAGTVWLPSGPHTIETAPHQTGPHLVRFSGNLKSARRPSATGIEFAYQSDSRALAVLDRPLKSLQVDGESEAAVLAGPYTLVLPRGQHVVTLTTD